MHYLPRGVNEASRILSASKTFLIYYDPDIDGAVAGELVRRFLTAYRQKFTYYINDNRAHGLRLTEEQVDSLRGQTIILVDAGMSKDEIVYLTSKGVNIINIDHHEIKEQEFVYVENEETGAKGVIINNQYPFEPNEYRFLSGAGVVYYVLKALAPTVMDEEAKALVGMSLISDIRVIENNIAADFLTSTYTYRSPFMQYLVDITKPDRNFGFGEPILDRNFLEYTFAPKLNALFRLNKGNDAVAVFAGTYANKVHLDINRNIQNAVVGDIVQGLQGRDLSNLRFKFIPHDLKLSYDTDVTNFIGVACSRLLNGGKTSFACVLQDGKIKRGSVRGLCDDVDYLGIFRKHGFQAEGHKNAFGVLSVDFSKVNIDALNAEIAEKENGYTQRKYVGRILEVQNLSFFANGRDASIANYNNYVRNPHRKFIKYTGRSYETNARAKVTDFYLDGLKVVSFEEGLTPENGLILPLLERGQYINFYLKGY